MLPPFPPGMEVGLFGMGELYGAERHFWQAPGVYTTAVGHAGDVEVVQVVFDPQQTSLSALLRVFWEAHDPTRAATDARRRSAILCASEEQRRAATASRDAYQRALSAAHRGAIVTEIAAAPEFQPADDDQQQYLAKHPHRHSELKGTGVRCS
jgi:peptide-methionine (S)-S-oxide reductase